MLVNKYDPIHLFIDAYNYYVWFENEQSTDTSSRKSGKEKSVDLSEMPRTRRSKKKKKKNFNCKTNC